MKTITLIGVNFYPEDTAIGIYTTQMVEYLSQKGHKINIITGFPYYPEWEIRKEYKKKARFYKETINSITVYRYKQYVPKNPTFFKRIIHLIDFTIGSFINSFKIKETDLIITVVPFTTTVFLGWILKKRLNAQLWTHIQDFEFDAAIQSGISNSQKGLIFNTLFKIEKYLLNKTDLASTISFSMLEKLKEKTKTPLFYFPNWIDKETINPKIAKAHSLYFQNNKFKILYSGNIGEKQDWHFFLEYMKELKEYKDVEVYIVGQGAKKEWLSKEILQFSFVKLFDPVPLNQLNDLLCSADLHLLFQKEDVLDNVMPSKILGMMASGKPSLITGNKDSEVSKIISQSKGGIYLQNNIKKVLTAFNNLYANNKLRKQIGKDAREYVICNFDSKTILHKFGLEVQNQLNNKS